MKKYIKALLLNMLVVGSSLAYGAPDLEAYGRLEQVSNMSISPNGELIAYRRTESDKKDSVVVYSLKEDKVISSVNVGSIDPQTHYFLNNDFLILTASKYFKEDKHGWDVSMAFSFDFKNHKLTPLIKQGETFSHDTTVWRDMKVSEGQIGIGGVVGQDADRKVLYMPAFIKKRGSGPIGRSYPVGSSSDYSLLKVDIGGEGVVGVASKGTPHTQNFFMDSKGNVIARESLNDKTNIHKIEVPGKNKWRTLYSYKSKIATHNFVGLNDNFNALVFSRSDSDTGYLQLSLLDGSVKLFEQMKLSHDTSEIIVDDYGVVMGVKYGGLSPNYLLSDAKVHTRVQSILSYFEKHSVHLADWTPDWKHIVVRVEGTQFAGDYYLFSEGQDPKLLAHSRPDISPEQINPIITSELKVRDGLAVPLILTLPKSKANNPKNLPAIIMPHSGPDSQDQVGFNYMAQALASRGYLVVQPQFRGSFGFGRKHLEAGWGEWGKGMQDDLTDSVLGLVKHGTIDPNRVCIVGKSYGGYAALAGAAFTPDVYKCAVSIGGVSDLPKMLAKNKSRFGSRSAVIDRWKRSILNDEYSKKELKAMSPCFSADTIKVPVLLLHGEQDNVVDYQQSEIMSKAIKKAKGDVRLVKLENDGHYLHDGANRTKAVNEIVTFVEKHIGI